MICPNKIGEKKTKVVKSFSKCAKEIKSKAKTAKLQRPKIIYTQPHELENKQNQWASRCELWRMEQVFFLFV